MKQVMIALLALAGSVQVANAAPAKFFTPAMKDLTKEIQDALKNDPKLANKKVKIGRFICPDDSDVSSEKKFVQFFRTELSAAIDDTSKLSLTGEFDFVTSSSEVAEGAPAGTKMKVIRVTIKLRLDGQVLFQQSAELTDTDEIYEIMNIQGAPPIGGNNHQRNDQAKKDYENPKFDVRNKTQISIDATYPVSVEVLLKSGAREAGTAEMPIDKNGKPFIAMKPGQYYDVLIRNDCDFEIAVELNIDGLNALEAFNVDAAKPRFYLVPAKGKHLIQGWLHSTSDTARDAGKSLLGFKVGILGEDTKLAMKKPESEIGSIVLGIHASWEKGKEPPAEVLKALSRSTTKLETRPGDGIPIDVRIVPREISPKLATLRVLYGLKE